MVILLICTATECRVERPTFESRGLVENLSLLSPCSSYSSTTRSTVHTANLVLFGAQAMHVTLAAPSWRKRGKRLEKEPKNEKTYEPVASAEQVNLRIKYKQFNV